MQQDGAQKRFYREATAVALETDAGLGGWGVKLDRFAVRTPAKAILAVPTAALAEALAAEWAAQGDTVVPATMPLTRLVNVALDRTPLTREAIISGMAGYVHGDLTCYRTPAPAGLAARQAQAWDPVHDWVETRLGARPQVTTGLDALTQPVTLETGFLAAARSLDDLRLTALASVTGIAGSAFLGLGLVERTFEAASVFAAIRIEEEWQAAIWGRDSDDDARAAARQADLEAAAQLVASLVLV